jgi:tRNA (cmo5U34)-methyltransferase
MSDAHAQAWIPQNWTFKDADVAKRFDSHVREQLPWYDLATRAVAHLGRHYVPKGGLVYDIGASTGNIGNALRDVLEARKARFTAIEESEQMAAHYGGPQNLVVADAIAYDYAPFDFAVAFLCLMFFPVADRRAWINRMCSLVRPGGAFVVVDKTVTPQGYVGTVLRRMAMSWKLDSGTTPAEIVEKELSLAGYQRPIEPSVFDGRASVFFQFGEFVGWVVERRE